MRAAGDLLAGREGAVAVGERPDALTKRELEILQLLGRGWSQGRIARDLVFPPRQ
jgi:DNA-binding NarL/FixJ family response regulator